MLKATTTQSRWLAGNYRKSPGFIALRLSSCLSLTRATSGVRVFPPRRCLELRVWSGKIKKGNSLLGLQHQRPESPNDFSLFNLSPVIILSEFRSNPFHPLHQLLSIRCLVSLSVWHFVKCSNLLSCQGEDKMRCTDWYSTDVTAAAASLNSAGKFKNKKTVQQWVVASWPQQCVVAFFF